MGTVRIASTQACHEVGRVGVGRCTTRAAEWRIKAYDRMRVGHLRRHRARGRRVSNRSQPHQVALQLCLVLCCVFKTAQRDALIDGLNETLVVFQVLHNERHTVCVCTLNVALPVLYQITRLQLTCSSSQNNSRQKETSQNIQSAVPAG